jgi:predicted transcriptional regulator of viral defense system
MGRVVHLDKLRAFAKSTPVFRAKDVEVLVKDKKYSHLVLHKLAQRGEVKRVVKGWYSLHEDPTVAVFCFKPAYIGLQEALSLHGLWEQETNVVIVTTLRVRTGIRRILDSNVILHRIDGRYFFGYDYIIYGDFFIPVSDVEKTLIDLVYFKELPGMEVVSSIKKRLDEGKLIRYLKRFPPRFRDKVIGYVS